MKFELYKLISYISILIFFISLILSTLAIKDEQPWLNQRLNEFKLINEFNLNNTHSYDLQLQYTLKYIQSYALDLDDNDRLYHIGKCSYNSTKNKHQIGTNNQLICGGPYNKESYNITKSIYYLNMGFIVFLIVMFVIEINYLIFEIVTRPKPSEPIPGEVNLDNTKIVSKKNDQVYIYYYGELFNQNEISIVKNKVGFYMMIFRFLYIIATVLMYISAFIFAFKFPNSVNTKKINNNDPSIKTELFAENGITFTFINCILTTIAYIFLIFSFLVFLIKLKRVKKRRLNNNINNNDKYSLLFEYDNE